MIRIITSYDECREFAAGFSDDPEFSDPMLTNEEQVRGNLEKAFEKPERYAVLGVFRDEQMVGLFNFLVLRDERYIEMIVGLSRDAVAYNEVLRYLETNYPSYNVDFVFNPRNHLLTKLLQTKGADFEPEQLKMVWKPSQLDVDTTGVELFSEQYAGQYFAIHNQDMYWTGEKVAAAPERFRTLLAVHEGTVVGYIDVTHCFEENEPYDLFVLEQYRRMGYGRKLLAKALQLNCPKDMMLLVDIDNAPAIHLYESMGFERNEKQNNVTVHWTVPA